MKNYTLVFLILLLHNFIYGQEQVTFNQNLSIDYDAFDKYFVEIEGQEYFLERYETFTSVSEIQDGELNFIHNLTERPTDGRYLSYGDLRYSNSGLFTKDKLIYETYEFNIYVTDIIEGTVVKDIDLCQYNIGPLASSLVFIEDLIVFVAYQDGVRSYFVFNTNTATVDNIDWTDDKIIYRADRYLYAIDAVDNTVSSYDIVEGDEVLSFEISEGIISQKINYRGLEPVLLITGNNNMLYEFENGVLSNQSDCYSDQDKEVFDFYFKGGLLFASVSDLGSYKTEVINSVGSCEIVNTIEGPEPGFGGPDVFRFHDVKGIGDRYLLMSAYGSYFSLGSHVIYDISDSTYEYYDLQTDFLRGFETQVKGNILYIIGIDDIELYGFVNECFAIDLENKTSFDITLEGGVNMFFARLGETREDEAVTIYTYSEFEEFNLWQIDNVSHSSELLKEIDGKTNIGVNYINSSFIIDEKLYFRNSTGLYVIEDDDTNLLLTTTPQTNLVERNGTGYVTIARGEKVVLYKIDLETNEIDSTIIDGITRIDTRSQGNEDLIFNFRNYSIGKGYIDLETETFVTMSFLDDFSGVSIKGVNTEGAIIKGDNFNDEVFYYYNTKLKTHKELELENEVQIAIDDGYKGFLLIDMNYGELSTNMTQLDHNGEFVKKVDVEYIRLFQDLDVYRNNDRLTLPLLADQKVTILVSHDNDFKAYSILYDDVKSYTNVFFRSNGVYSVLQSREDGESKIHYMSYENEPLEISKPNPDLILHEAAFGDNRMVLFYHDITDHKLYIDIFDLVTGALVAEQNVVITKSRYPTIRNLGNLDKRTMIVSLNDGILGQELYSLDIDDNTLTGLFDLREGYLGSDPNNHFQIGEYHYFTAISEDGSHQWFRFDGSEFINITELDNYSNFLVYPNPSKSQIHIDEKLENIRIFDSQGKEHFPNFVNDQIDISLLSSGMYFIQGVNDDQKAISSSFIKI